MTRDEFMKWAENEIEAVLTMHKRRIMNVVERAWAEGKRNSELDTVTKFIKDAIDKADQERNKQDATKSQKATLDMADGELKRIFPEESKETE